MFSCHLVLGEVEDAMRYFNKCLESGVDVCLDRRTMIQAADGLQKSEVPHSYYFGWYWLNFCNLLQGPPL